jgi:hypothetical protein
MKLIFRRSTHDADGNYKFADRPQEPYEKSGGLVHDLDPKLWMTVDEVFESLRGYEDQFRGDLDACPDRTIPQILRGLAHLVENGYAEAKEIT